MALRFYRDEAPNIGNLLDPVDLFSGNGLQTTFILTKKTGADVGNTCQFNETQYFKNDGGFTIFGDAVTLDSAPAAGTQGVIPGRQALVLGGYDQDEVQGLVDPRVEEKEVWLFDIDDINVFCYENPPGDIGINLTFVDNISSVGATLAWVQLACADCAGDPLTYAATGETLYTPNFCAFGLLATSVTAGATSIQLDSASTFICGDYVILNIGGGTEEIVKITAVTPTAIETEATVFSHSTSETAYTCGRKFWAKLTVPLNITGGEATNLYDISLDARAKKVQRI